MKEIVNAKEVAKTVRPYYIIGAVISLIYVITMFVLLKEVVSIQSIASSVFSFIVWALTITYAFICAKYSKKHKIILFIICIVLAVFSFILCIVFSIRLLIAIKKENNNKGE